MQLSEDTGHMLLLIITVLLFIFLVTNTGLGESTSDEAPSTIITTGA